MVVQKPFTTYKTLKSYRLIDRFGVGLRRLRGSCRESAHPSIADVMLQHRREACWSAPNSPRVTTVLEKLRDEDAVSTSMRPANFSGRAARRLLDFDTLRNAMDRAVFMACYFQCGPFYFEPYEADRPASSADRAPGRSS